MGALGGEISGSLGGAMGVVGGLWKLGGAGTSGL